MKRCTYLIFSLLLALTALEGQSPVSALDSILDIPVSGSYSDDILIVPGALSSGIFFEYQFTGSSSWVSLDSVLCLAALSGEQRTYNLSFRQKNRVSTDQMERIYVIDKKKPLEPVIAPQSSDVFEELTLEFTGPDAVFYSISPDTEFLKYDSANPPVFKARPDMARHIVVTAYCVDEAGNASLPTVSSYRLLAKNFLPSSYFQPIIQKRANFNSVEISSAESVVSFSDLGYYNGFSLLGIQAPNDVEQVYIVIGDAPSSDFGDYVKVSLLNGVAGIPIPFPLGYKKTLSVFCGTVKNGILTVGSKPFSLSAASSGNTRGISFDSPDPQIIPLFGNAMVYWPETDNSLFYSIQGSRFMRYTGPFSIPASSENITLSWYSQDVWGNISGNKSRELMIAKQRLPPQPIGAENFGVYGLPVVVRADGDGIVRYTLALGENPPPVTAASQAVSDGISIPGEKKTRTSYTLRMVAFDAADMPGPDALITFTIDRVDPEPPSFVIIKQASFNAPLTVECNAAPGLKIFYAISGSTDGNFAEYQQPFVFTPNSSARQCFAILAYTENALGLRSEIGKAANIIVDGSAIYLDSSAGINGSGSPNDPVSTLSEALKLAELHNVSKLYIRGRITVDQSLLIDRNMQFSGSFDSAWQPSAVENTVLDFSRLMGTIFPYVMIEKAVVSFSGIGFTSNNSASKKFFDLNASAVTLENCDFKVMGGSDINLFSQKASSLSIRNTALDFSAVIALRCIYSVSSETTLEFCRISADSTIRLFEFFNGNGGRFAVRDTVLEASPQLMFSGFVLANIDFSMQRSYFKVLSGSTTCRLLQANNSNVSINSFYSEIYWNGNVENFSVQNNSRLAIYHSTFRNSSRGLSFLNARNSSFVLANSIINAEALQAGLINADKIDDASFVLANCIYGYTQFLEGPINAHSLESLNAIFFKPNTRYYNYPVKNFQEDPEKTFLPSTKGFSRISPLSACIDSGLVLFPLYKNTDIHNELVPSGKGKSISDIGADEL